VRHAEFEEKDFEGPLYNQLLGASNNLATPGQVFEGKFGIDAALQATHPVIWEAFGYPHIPGGVVLPDFNWGWVWRKLGKVRPLPNFAVNLLLQAKRPDRLNGINAGLSKHGIKGGYWRFTVNEHQHILLDRIRHTLGNRALVTYASTAFDTFDELYDYTEHGTIVEHASFVRVQRMNGHSDWNFDEPGSRGVATSKPEPIDDPPLGSEIDRLAARRSDQAALATLESFYNSVMGVLRENAERNATAAFLLRRHELISSVLSDVGVTRPEILPFVTLGSTFSHLNLDWFVIG
jgi:hypothetical protein